MLKSWLLATMMLSLFSGYVQAGGQVVACKNADGATYYADDCGDDPLVEEVKLGKTSRLDPAPENPIQGLQDYYSRIYMMAKLKLRDLGIVD